MRKPAAGTALLVLFFGPATSLLGVAVLLNPAATATCLPSTNIAVASVPDRLTATTSAGVQVILERAQLRHAATILTVGARTKGVGRDGVMVALMAALTESRLRMLANTTAYPESASYPNDGDASDHDSLGMFQMRPSTGWGTVRQLMDPGYQARAFFGGPTGPNQGSPRGLLDIPGWRQLSPGAAAQTVEVSAHPDRYARFAQVAVAIMRALTRSGPGGRQAPVAAPGRVVFPLPTGSWHRTDSFGPRTDPLTGDPDIHTGVDYAASAGTPILAIAAGRVIHAGPVASGYANLIVIGHRIAGRRLVSAYAHMEASDIRVREGEVVSAGQAIAEVGAAGNATGPHLHLEIRPGGRTGTPLDPEGWLGVHGATQLAAATTVTRGCDRGSLADARPYQGANPSTLVDDPTSNGAITRATAHVLAQLRQRFPGSSWACWRPGGSRSEHPQGRACDGTFGNTIGQPATGGALARGWRVTNWLKHNAQALGIAYLIWQGRIWSRARAEEGWRAYDGGGMHNPQAVTGGHYDHLHWTSSTPRGAL